MAKGQMRPNKETRKPKKDKKLAAAAKAGKPLLGSGTTATGDKPKGR